ncbi:DUF1127 domain-containing protein [Brucella sp. BE17]|uniref:DUF1127 domain-containing protein n=1 Tax=Brucella sp. BE17 TaxID=3142977 RepID=UPI0031BA1688
MFYFRQEIDTIDTMLPQKQSTMTEVSSNQIRPRRGPLRRLIDWLTWQAAIRRSRLALYELTDEQLRDVGLGRCEAEKEARKVRFHLR